MTNEIIFLNDKFLPIKEATISVLDRGFTLGDGLFETLRAYGGIVFRLKDHLERLFHSSQKIFLEIPYSKERLGDIVYETLIKNQLQEAYIRITITRGEGLPGLSFPENPKPTIVVFAKEFSTLPKEYYEHGIKIATFPYSATQTATLNPQVKSCNYLSQIVIKELAKQKEAFEGIILEDDKKVTEGTVSNIFVIKDGNLKTPPLSPFILPGITRKVILELASKALISCEETQLTVENIYQADEVFIVNTGIEILPVSHADSNKIGNGYPGEITKALSLAFFKTVEELRKK
jgi:branched-chain amino acid aminotransferase